MSCHAYKLINEADTKYCQRCGKPLTVEVAHTEKSYMEEAFTLFGKIMANPKLKKQFEEFKIKEEI